MGIRKVRKSTVNEDEIRSRRENTNERCPAPVSTALYTIEKCGHTLWEYPGVRDRSKCLPTASSLPCVQLSLVKLKVHGHQLLVLYIQTIRLPAKTCTVIEYVAREHVVDYKNTRQNKQTIITTYGLHSHLRLLHTLGSTCIETWRRLDTHLLPHNLECLQHLAPGTECGHPLGLQCGIV